MQASSDRPTPPDDIDRHRCELTVPGMRVSVLTYGGVIERIEAPDRGGKMQNVVLGMPTLDGYIHRSPYFGALLGRYANRIAGGRFTLDGRQYQIAVNNGPNALHGGAGNWSHRVWQVAARTADRLTLALDSPDGDAGFPGRVQVRVTHMVAPGLLQLDYEATTDAPTVINLSNHAYWNLAGEGTGSALNHLLTIPAERYLPVDAAQLPLGDPVTVGATPFDFRSPTAIGARIRGGHEQLLPGLGYDHCWVFGDARPGTLRLAARLTEPRSGRGLEVLTDQPGLQFYSGNRLDGSLVGSGGRAYRQSDGLAFETQHFPDSANHPAYPSTVLRPGDTFRSRTVFRLFVEG